jgi:hypothetical protein
MVLLIASEGKKWGLHYHHTGNGGKKWEKMFRYVGVKVGRGDCPPCDPSSDILSNQKKVIPNHVWISLFSIYNILYLCMTDILTYNLSKITEDRVCVEVSVSGVSMGVLYFERPKRGWNKKPILPTKWSCVDASVEGLYIYGGENITPKDIISRCQELIENL